MIQKFKKSIVALIFASAANTLFMLLPLSQAFAQQSSSSAPVIIGSGPTRVVALLPSPSGPFKWATAAVVAGMKAAHARDAGAITIEVLDTDDQLLETRSGLSDVYNELEARRVALVVGPLTRNSVNALTGIGRLPITTITLNQPDPEYPLAGNMVVFGLAIDSEATQVARVSFDDAALRIPTRRPLKASVAHNTTVQGRRGASAFIQQWQALGGEIVSTVETDSKNLANDKLFSNSGNSANKPDVVFIAVSADAAKGFKQTLPPDTAVYGTSQLNNYVVGSAARFNDLNGIRVVDMPWQIQADHIAVMAYPRASGTLSTLEQQRLYALGIDTYRIVRELVAQRGKFEIDGVTGRLKVDLSHSQRVERTGLVAEFRRGQPVPFEGR
jgi:uncharacterized protein